MKIAVIIKMKELAKETWSMLPALTVKWLDGISIGLRQFSCPHKNASILVGHARCEDCGKEF